MILNMKRNSNVIAETIADSIKIGIHASPAVSKHKSNISLNSHNESNSSKSKPFAVIQNISKEIISMPQLEFNRVCCSYELNDIVQQINRTGSSCSPQYFHMMIECGQAY